MKWVWNTHMGRTDTSAPGIERAKLWARSVKRDVIAIWIAARDARTPAAARILAALVAAYALSPLDLIPDFIPVLGYLDDLLLVPLGILAVVKLIPTPLMAEYRNAATRVAEKPRSIWGLLLIAAIWVLAVVLTTALLTDLL